MDQLQCQQLHQLIASYTGKVLREHFGKGPESVIVSISHTFTTIYLKSFLVASERVLLEENDERIVRQMRSRIMQRVIPELKSYIERVMGVSPESILYDWDFENRSGMLVVIFSDVLECSDSPVVNYQGKIEIEREISRISARILKEPLEIASYEVNPRTLLVVRQGMLGELEKELLLLDLGDLLKDVKRRLEKDYITESAVIGSALNRTITDCFMDWDYAHDRNVIVIVMQPQR